MTEHKDPQQAPENDAATAASAQEAESFPLADPEFEDLLDEEDQQIDPPTDIGENAQQVVTALLGHQQDLVAELRSVYERLEQVREVDYAALEGRVKQAESVVEAAPSAAELQELIGLLEGMSGTLKEHENKQAELEQQLRDAREHHATQLAERDARIAAQNARIEELEAGITAAAESAESAHDKLQVLAQETNSSLIHRMGERVSPAAQQARNALSNIRRRFRR